MQSRRKSVTKSLILAALPVVAMPFSARAAQIGATWNAGGVGSWSNATRWSTNPLVPGNGGGNTFDATINSSTARATLDANFTIDHLALGAGTLSGASTLNLLGGGTLTGGTLDGAGTLNIAGGTLMISAGTGTIGLTGFNIATDANANVRWTSGRIVAVGGEGGAFYNSGTFYDSSDDGWDWNVTLSPVINNLAGATFNKGSGALGASQFLQPVFNNAGTFNVFGASIWLGGGGTSSGMFNVSGGTTLVFSDFNESFSGAGSPITTLQASSVVNSQGTVRFDNNSGNANTDVFGKYDSVLTVISAGSSGHVNFKPGSHLGSTFTGDLQVFSGALSLETGQEVLFNKVDLQAGEITGADNRTIFDSFTWGGGKLSGASTTYVYGGVNINAFSAAMQDHTLFDGSTDSNWTTGNIALDNSHITNQSGNTWRALDNSRMFNSNTAVQSEFNNFGTFVKSGGSLTTNFDAVDFNNYGTVGVQTGTLRLGGYGFHGGTFNIAGGATLEFGGASINFNSTYHDLFAGSSIQGASGSTFVASGDTYIEEDAIVNVDKLRTTAYLWNGGTLTSNSAVSDNGGQIDIPSGHFTNAGDLKVGVDGFGWVLVSEQGQIITQSTTTGINSLGSGLVSVVGADARLDNSGSVQFALAGFTFAEVDGGTMTNTSADIAVSADDSQAIVRLSNAGRWINSGSIRIGGAGEATVTVETAAQLSNTDATIADGTASFGSVAVRNVGSTWTNSGNLNVAVHGAGSLTIEDGGAVSASNAFVGGGTSSLGTLIVQDPGSNLVTQGYMVLGNQGSASLSISNGGTVSNAQAIVATYSNVTANALITGTDSKWTTGSLSLGNAGAATMQIAGGGNVTSGDVRVGDSATASGTAVVDGSGSIWTIGNATHIGYLGNGTVTASAGGKITGVDIGLIGEGTASNGMATITGAGSRWENESQIGVGVFGAGTLVIADGGVVATKKATSTTGSAGIVGRYGTGVGTVIVTGAGSRWENLDGSFNVGFGSLLVADTLGSRGTAKVDNGGVLTSTDGFIARNDGGIGTATIGGNGTGARWEMSGSLYVAGNDTLAAANGAAGTLVVNTGGTVSAPGGIKVWNNGTILYNGGTIDTPDLALTGGGRMILSATGNKTLKLTTLTIDAANDSLLDLADNDLIVTNTPKATIQAYISSARHANAWDHAGITSTTARNWPDHVTGLGILSGDEYSAAHAGATTFNGISFTPTTTLVKFTYNGDTDLNGRVDFDDYFRIDTGFNTQNQPGAVIDWFTGDFDFNNRIDFDDYAMIDLAFNNNTGSLARALAYLDGSDASSTGMDSPALQMIEDHFEQFGVSYAQSFLSAVPEPTTATMLLVGVALCARRRKRATRR